MRFLALLKDSFRQTLDSRIFWVLAVGITAVLVGVLLVGFTNEGVSLAFGLHTIPYASFGDGIANADGRDLGRFFVLAAQYFINSTIVGFLGVILAVIVTASFVPHTLQPGTIEILLSKPVARFQIVLARYLGGLLFIFLLASYLIAGLYLAFGANSGFFNHSFLLSVVPLVGYYGIIYSVTVLVGIVSRGTTASILVTFLFMMVCSAVQGVYKATEIQTGGEPILSGTLRLPLAVAHWILPKTEDLDLLNTWLVFRQLPEGSPVEPIAVKALNSLMSVDATYVALSAGSTLAFVAAMLILAVWIFKRRDF